MNKAILLIITVCGIILVGCNNEKNDNSAQDELTEVNKQEDVSPLNQENRDSVLTSELTDELKTAITNQMALEIDSIMLETYTVNGVIEVTCSIGLLKDVEIEDNTVDQLIEVIINTVSKKDNLSISEDNIEITKGSSEVIKKFNEKK